MPLVPFKVVREQLSKLYQEDADPKAFRAMAVIYSAQVAGTRADELAQYTGYPLEEVAPMVANLKRYRIFGDMDVLVNFFDKENPAHALRCFAWVAAGDMTYDPATDKFNLTQDGVQLAQALDKERRRRR